MKSYTWKDLVELFEGNRWGGPAEALEQTPRRYRVALATAFSVVKWHPTTQYRGLGACGLCELFLDHPKKNEDGSTTYIDDGCARCPLFKAGDGCREEGSTWSKAITMVDTYVRKEPANQLYAMLLKIYAKLWNQL
jgi:hypothetical protein